MDNPELLKRITVRADVFGGKPIIRNMRFSVETILSLLAQGASARKSWTTTRSSKRTTSALASRHAHAAIAGDTLAAVSVETR